MTNRMCKILIFILFTSQVVFGQSKIQHEPEQIFNNLNIDKSVAEFAKEHKIEKITFLRDTIISSSIEFDKNGNSICEIGMENKLIRKTLRKYDNLNREIETRYFNPDNIFSHGYYYKYEDGFTLMFELEDSLIYLKMGLIKPENILIYSEYDDDGSILSKDIISYNDVRIILETSFQNNRLYAQYIYEYIDDKSYITEI